MFKIIKKNKVLCGIWFINLLLLILLFLTASCASSTTHFTKISETEYMVVQKGQADVEVTKEGIVKITNPQSTLAGLWKNIKEILQAVGGRLQTSKEIK